MKIFGFSFVSLLLLAQAVAAAPATPPGRDPAVVTAKIATVPAKLAASPTKVQPVNRSYRVLQGDNLYSIAHAHGMTLGEIKNLNGISADTMLQPGQTILVSNVKSSRKNPARVTKTRTRELPIALPTLSELAEANETLTAAEGIEPIARSYLTIPYRYGGETRRSTDCSGFTQQVFREFDINLPRTAREQYDFGAKVATTELQSGDLLFFRTRAKKKYPTHVGIYLGNGLMIHASPTNRKVVIAEANNPYFIKRFVGAKRIARFLPGDVDLETLSRQVGELDNQLLPAAPTTDEVNPPAATLSDPQTATDESAHAGQIQEAESAPRDEDPEVEPDFDVEPEPVAVPESQLGEREGVEGVEGAAAIATLTSAAPHRNEQIATNLDPAFGQ